MIILILLKNDQIYGCKAWDYHDVAEYMKYFHEFPAKMSWQKTILGHHVSLELGGRMHKWAQRRIISVNNTYNIIHVIEIN